MRILESLILIKTKLLSYVTLLFFNFQLVSLMNSGLGNSLENVILSFSLYKCVKSNGVLVIALAPISLGFLSVTS